MRASTSVLLVAVGLFVLWLAATGRLARIGQAWEYLNQGTVGGTALPPTGAKPNGSTLPTVAPLPSLPGTIMQTLPAIIP